MYAARPEGWEAQKSIVYILIIIVDAAGPGREFLDRCERCGRARLGRLSLPIGAREVTAEETKAIGLTG